MKAGGDDNHCLPSPECSAWVCKTVCLGGKKKKKEIKSVIQWILGNQAWGFLFPFKGVVISEAGLWKKKELVKIQNLHELE